MPLTALRIEVPTPFQAAGAVNVWYLPGEEPTLVDAGPHTDEAWIALRAALAAHAIDPARLRHLVVTHAHVDHYGNSGRLAALAPQATLHAPDLAHARPTLLDDDEEWARQAHFVRRALEVSGLSATQVEASRRGLGSLRTFGRPVPVSHWLRPGERWRFGAWEWEVVALPGHSMTQIGLLALEAGLFLAADHLLPGISSNALLEPPPPGERRRPRALPIYIESLRQSATLPPLRVLPGHGLAFFDQHPLIERRLAGIEARAATLHDLLAEGERSVIELVESLFPTLDPGQLFLAVSEIVGHLDLLEERGVIAYDHHEGVRRYRRVQNP